MKVRTYASVAAFAALSLVFAGCGGDDDTNAGDRPSVSEMATAMEKQLEGSVPDGVDLGGLATCVAERLDESEIPDGVLRALVAGEDASVDADNEDKYTGILTDASMECATEAVGG